MDITPLIRKGQNVITAYADGMFRIGAQTYDRPVIITPEDVYIWDIPAQAGIDALQIDHFAVLIEKANDIDVVLLGCGKTMAFLPPDLKTALKESGLCVDTMDTGAACRTYNVLMAEGRRIACALLCV